MAKDPAFLFYPNDWIGGTMGMTFEEKGAYLELLMAQFNRGHMTIHMIGQIVGQNWDMIKDKFIQDDKGLYYNARLELEQTKRKEYSKSRNNNRSGNNQHTKKPKKESGHMTGHMEDEDVNEDKDINGSKIEIKKSTSGTQKQPNLNYQLKELFEAQYLSDTKLDYDWTPKDWGASKKLIQKIKNSHFKQYDRVPTDESILASLQIIFTQLPDWYKTNQYSMTSIDSKYNEILNQISNGSNSKIKQARDLKSAFDKIDAINQGQV